MQKDRTASKKQSSSRIVNVSVKNSTKGGNHQLHLHRHLLQPTEFTGGNNLFSPYGNNFGIEHREGPTSFISNLGSMIREWYISINQNCLKKMDRNKVSIQKTVWQICSKRQQHITNSTLNFIRSDSNLLFWTDITGHADYLTQDTYFSLLVRDQISLPCVHPDNREERSFPL